MGHPVIALVGRPNVGKSALFNRLLGRRKALVQDTPGVTRDRNYAIAEISDLPLILCDTGGFEERAGVADDRMARLIREQALVAIRESDVVVFVMDVRAGLLPADEEIAARMRGLTQPVLWVLNKCDNPGMDAQVADFYRLGVPEFLCVSAEHGRGVGDLADAIVAALPGAGQERAAVPEPLRSERKRRSRRKRQQDQAQEKGGRLHFLGGDMPEEPTTALGPAPQAWDPRTDPDSTALAGDLPGEEVLLPGSIPEDAGGALRAGPGFLDVDATEGGEGTLPGPPPGWQDFEPSEGDDFVPRIALLGRPNVGKSTLLNRMLGYQRSITSPEAGTTHDTVDAFLEHGGRSWVLIDTAGIRRQARVSDRVEQLTVGRALRTVEAAHVCLLLLDGSEGVTEQEARLGSQVVQQGRALVLVVNKWDLRPRGQKPRQEFAAELRMRFPHLSFADVLFVSALNGRGTEQIWEAIERADEAHRMTIRTGPLNRWAQGVWALCPPPMLRHRPIRLYYCAQSGVRPPTFVFFCNQGKALEESYRRFLGNQIRAAFPAPGSPIRLIFRDRTGD